jgi:hypothetical protein
MASGLGHADEAVLVRCVTKDVMPVLARGLAEQHGIDDLIQLKSAASEVLFGLLFQLYATGRGARRRVPSLSKRHLPGPLLIDARRRLRCVNYHTLPVRVLGSIHETLLGLKLDRDFRLVSDAAGRKSSGSYYTPDDIAKEIVRHTLGPLVRRKLRGLRDAPARRVLEALRDVTIVDPAMGGGHFLVAAADYITAQVGRIAQKIAPARVRAHVVEHCLYGVDPDPMSALISRMSLWLTSPTVPVASLEAHLRQGDGLKTFAANHFDAVLCNPPYLGHKKDVNAASLRESFTVCRHHANLAAAFCERCLTLLKPRGRFGLIVPKALQYVQSWADTRALLSRQNRLEHLIDVSEAFDNVLLEQTICIGARAPARLHYRAGAPSGMVGFAGHVPLQLSQQLDCLPARLEPQSIPLFHRIHNLGPRLGAIAKTGQALGYQSHVTNGDSTLRADAMKIFRGRHIQPLSILDSRDSIPRSLLQQRNGNGYTPKIAAMLRPKVVSQNIVAHVTRPRPRIWIISAPDPAGVLCLNTISTTLIHDERFPIEYVSVVLNSSLASWFYYEFVFCRAVRTMHFDGYYAGKLPIAVPRKRDVRACERVCADPPAAVEKRQAAIDAIVFDAYQLSAQERTFVQHFCYGD